MFGIEFSFVAVFGCAGPGGWGPVWTPSCGFGGWGPGNWLPSGWGWDDGGFGWSGGGWNQCGGWRPGHDHHHHHHKPCFLTGTMIRMADGSERAVQNIEAGDRVQVLENGALSVLDVTWSGYADTVVQPNLPDDQAAYPVRIARHAFGENQPARDLLVTSEHCVFVDDAFVPVRMLVNGATIAYDRSVTHYTYHHVETSRHAVLFSENLTTESYLDTGNRRNFRSGGNVVWLGRARSWDEAAAPLVVAAERVQPVHAALAARAEALGYDMAPAPLTTDDADLYLTTACGHVLRPARQTGRSVMFMLPAGVEAVRISSRVGRPSDVIGPFVDDRRELGVLVGAVTLWDSGQTRAIDAHLTSEALSGWSVRENAPMRWTTGDAELHLGARAVDAVGALQIEILAAGPYRVEGATPAVRALA